MKKEIFNALKNPSDFWGRKIQSIFHAIKKEIQYVGLLFIAGLVIFKIVFFNEKLFVVFRIVLSLFWLFVIPGWFIMLYWKEKLEFIERLVIGTALSAGVTGVASYYFGLFGLNLKYHAVLLPLVIIFIGFVAAAGKKDSHHE